MSKQTKTLLRVFFIAALGLTSFAKTPRFTGKMVAYDPLLHASKSASVVANREEVILEVAGKKAKYLKVVVVSVGTTQLDPKYFDGTTPLTVRAFRDHSCDENSPRLVTQVSLDQKSGTYLLTDAFKNAPPAKIKTLECYESVEKK